jgi:hypothetical protein
MTAVRALRTGPRLLAKTSQSRAARAGAADDDAGIGIPIARPALIMAASTPAPVTFMIIGGIDMSLSRLAVRRHRENDDAGRRVSFGA